jgi:ribosomal protein L18
MLSNHLRQQHERSRQCLRAALIDAQVAAAAVGAPHGEKALPMRWRASLLGRSCVNDQGRIQALLDAAVRGFA